MSQIQLVNIISKNVLNSASLTNAVQTSPIIGRDVLGLNDTAINPVQFNQLTLFVRSNLGSLTSISLQLQFSQDGINWHNETLDNVNYSTGLITQVSSTRSITSTTGNNIVIPVKISYRYIRINYSGVGTTTGSSLTIDAILAQV